VAGFLVQESSKCATIWTWLTAREVHQPARKAGRNFDLFRRSQQFYIDHVLNPTVTVLILNMVPHVLQIVYVRTLCEKKTCVHGSL